MGDLDDYLSALINTHAKNQFEWGSGQVFADAHTVPTSKPVSWNSAAVPESLVVCRKRLIRCWENEEVVASMSKYSTAAQGLPHGWTWHPLPKGTPINIFDQSNFRTLAESPEFNKKTPSPTPRRPHWVYKAFNVS
jgi:hypothetical protein